MDCQDWIPVVSRRRYTKQQAAAKGQTTIQARDPAKGERVRLAKLEESDAPPPKKRIASDTL